LFTDALDSYYQYVKARILAVNQDRIVGGMLDAQDWPSKPFKLDTFYLLTLHEEPPGKEFYSQYAPPIFHSVQWVWVNKGMDLNPGERKANRGDRYRTNEQMKGELLIGAVPGYAEKFSWALDANGNWVSTPLDPPEVITWKPLEFHKKSDKDSGIIYGAAATRIFDMTDVVAS
jgi:hypothetical protein